MDNLLKMLKEKGSQISESELKEFLLKNELDPDNLDNSDVAKAYRLLINSVTGEQIELVEDVQRPLKSRTQSRQVASATKFEASASSPPVAKGRQKLKEHREKVSPKTAAAATSIQVSASTAINNLVDIVNLETASVDEIMAKLAEQHAYNTDPRVLYERLHIEAAKIQQENAQSLPEQFELRGRDEWAQLEASIDGSSHDELLVWLEETERENDRAIMAIGAAVD